MRELTNKYRVIDVDTHVIEPYDLWTSRISVQKYGDLVPHVRWDEKTESDSWFFADTRYNGAAASAQAGWHEYPPYRPRRLSDVDPATWRAEDRLKRMDEYGIHAQILYPNVIFFGADTMIKLKDTQLMLEIVRAYNDWQSEWSSADSKRFFPQTVLPFWDMDLTLAEIDRCSKYGHRGVVLAGEPEFFGQPRLTDPHWDRLWAAAQERGLPINFHIGGGDHDLFHLMHPSTGPHASFAGMSVLFFLTNARPIVQLIMGGVCHRFPTLNIVSVESGVGWLPFMLESMDWQWLNSGGHKEHPEYKLLPSEFFKRQFYGAFWFEKGSFKSAIEQLGADNIVYETDFPHPTSMSPGPATAAQVPSAYIDEIFSGVAPGDVQKILHDNAARIYHID